MEKHKKKQQESYHKHLSETPIENNGLLLLICLIFPVLVYIFKHFLFYLLSVILFAPELGYSLLFGKIILGLTIANDIFIIHIH